MTSFFAAYRNETDKILLRWKYRIFLLLGISICLLWAVMGILLPNIIILPLTSMGILPLFSQVLMPLIIFMGAADLITAEGEKHTMKAMIYRPVERFKLYTAKLLAIKTYVILYLACVFVVSAMLSLEITFASLASYALTIMPLAVFVAFAAFIALLGRSSSLVMFLMVVIYLAMIVMPIFVPVLSELLFTSYLGWYRLWIGIQPGIFRLIHMVIIVFSYGAVFFIAGSLIFDRKAY